MISRLPGAILRASLVVILITLPSLVVPQYGSDGLIVMLLVAFSAAVFVLVEYAAASPSFVEFRSAPPMNRLRFAAFFLCVYVLSLIGLSEVSTDAMARLAGLVAGHIGSFTDMPFSPVSNLLMLLPDDTARQQSELLRNFAGVAYLMSLLTVGIFLVLLRLRRWPKRRESFNVWINLPRFDPTASGDVVARLNRDSTINVILGFLLPFLVPVVLKFMSLISGPIVLDELHTMIWVVAIWAFVPASILMRGIALSRVAGLIHKERKRAYKQAVADGMLPA
ncbi:MAG: hypothetical protein LC676_05475 [Loktanella sp.]|nr:hypothetical protein [Loktanella sp.]